MEALLVKNVTFRWPNSAMELLSIGELRVPSGSSLFLHGPSGSGKSTLLSLLAGVLRATSGEVRIAGQDWGALSPPARDQLRADHVGYIFQQFNLLPFLSPIANVQLPCRLSAARRARLKVSLSAAAAELLEALGLHEEVWKRPVGLLSVGQQQRVAAARALIGAPAVVIADEPTSSLDEGSRDAFLGVLLNTGKAAGSSIVFVSHDHRLYRHFDASCSLASINRGASGEGAYGACR